MINLAIQSCSNAFLHPFCKRPSYNDILDKIYYHGCFIVAHTDEILGCAAFYANDCKSHEAYLTLIAVFPEFQGMQIGSHLLQRFEDIAFLKGFDHTKLEVEKGNIKAIEFYKLHDYQILSYTDHNTMYMTKCL